jgi:hypothetical protein
VTMGAFQSPAAAAAAALANPSFVIFAVNGTVNQHPS